MHALEWIAETGRFMRRVDAMALRRALDRKTGECTWCGSPVPKGRRKYCSRGCAEEFENRMLPSFIRNRIRKRDKGVCAKCGLDTKAMQGRILTVFYRAKQLGRCYSFARIKRLANKYRCATYQSPWEADHTVPVIEGGGCCGLDGYRTLCIPCHKVETKELAARRARERRESKETATQTLFTD